MEEINFNLDGEFETSKDRPKVASRAVLVGMATYENPQSEVEKSLDELSRLLDTAGGETFAKMIQSKSTPDPRTMIGSGKIKELAELCKNNSVKLVVFDFDLSPSQIRNIEDELGDDVSVIDRSMLILDIFALHATTKDGKLQVELAQLKYTAPRLYGKGNEMSRLGGGIGTRGPGESKLESDKRHMKRRITALEQELEILDKNRKTMRVSRDRSGLPKVAIVGYTNAGKSTMLNRLTDAGILAEDKLFATLDPTTRKYTLPSGEDLLLTDTVGFIRKLPHHLVKAFKSTLDEAGYADILMIIIDASDSEYRDRLAVTEELLDEIGASGKPILYVFNKCDAVEGELPTVPDIDRKNTVYVSAKSGEGMDRMLERLGEIIRDGKKKVTFVFPNSEQGSLNILYKNATVDSVDYGDENVVAVATVDRKAYGMLKKYACEKAWRDESDGHDF